MKSTTARRRADALKPARRQITILFEVDEKKKPMETLESHYPKIRF